MCFYPERLSMHIFHRKGSMKITSYILYFSHQILIFLPFSLFHCIIFVVFGIYTNNGGNVNVTPILCCTYVNVRIIIRLPNTMEVFMNLNTFEWIYNKL
jgi:hypothetical protein